MPQILTNVVQNVFRYGHERPAPSLGIEVSYHPMLGISIQPGNPQAGQKFKQLMPAYVRICRELGFEPTIQ
jgi:hypothetical protein